MFNPEKLLGGLMRSGMGRSRRRGVGSLITGGAALGLVGVAMEAVEHFMNQSRGDGTPGSPSTGATPPPASPGGAQRGGPPIPPSPGPAASPPPPPPGGLAAPQSPSQGDAVLLIQAMVAAANADGAIDAEERAQIVNQLEALALSDEDRQFIMQELLAPKDAQTIADGASSQELAQQVYLVSLMAIEVDTDAERRYLQALAEALDLSQEQVARIHDQLGVQPVNGAPSIGA